MLETIATDGGKVAIGVPRGSGKTSLCEAAALWAVLSGKRKFLALICATSSLANQLSDHIKGELEANDLLFADFPEVCFPIQALDGIANRAPGQTCQGERTRIQWRAGKITLPRVAGSAASGARIFACGITGALRGIRDRGPKGEIIRPDIVVVDDPQTDRSARSHTLTEQRKSLLNNAVLGLVGPDSKLAVAVACTVIQPGDMADEILDRNKKPEWNGIKHGLLEKFPTDLELWSEYHVLRKEGFRAGSFTAANDFYKENQAAMDAGAMASWPARYPNALSAIQYSMDLFLDDEESFFSEYQNAPKSKIVEKNSCNLEADLLNLRHSGHDLGDIPATTKFLTAFVDVQKNLLFFTVVAWDEFFGGAIVDYGAWPVQSKKYYSLSTAQPTLAQVYPGLTEEAAIFRGLKDLTRTLLVFSYGERKIQRLIIDSGNWTDTIYDFVKKNDFGNSILASKGMGIAAGNTPMRDWIPKKGECRGDHWVQSVSNGTLLLKYDTFYWKSFVARRLLLAEGTKGALFLPGTESRQHLLLAEHLSSEYAVETSSQDLKIDKWHLRPGRDNHLFDCLVGSAMAAAFDGLDSSASIILGMPADPEKKKIKLSDLYKNARKKEF